MVGYYGAMVFSIDEFEWRMFGSIDMVNILAFAIIVGAHKHKSLVLDSSY
jgi:hypothetical protein